MSWRSCQRSISFASSARSHPRRRDATRSGKEVHHDAIGRAPYPQEVLKELLGLRETESQAQFRQSSTLLLHSTHAAQDRENAAACGIGERLEHHFVSLHEP